MTAYQNWKNKLYTPRQKETFALSRSKIELFVECPKCFYLDRVHGVSRPKTPSFLINMTIDELLKKEFDQHRKDRTPHPLMIKNNIDAIPFNHAELQNWRNNFKGIRTVHEPTNLEIFGAVDDLWISPDNDLYVVDYKATSKNEEITLEDRWKAGYKRQIEIYQWLLKQQGFNVSARSFFVFANAIQDQDSFDSKLDFDMTVLEYQGQTHWIDEVLNKIKHTLDSLRIPKQSVECEYCSYVLQRESTTQSDETIIQI